MRPRRGARRTPRRIPARAAELRAIAGSCEHLATRPARTFQEALQLIWLVALPLQKVAGCGVLNFSRMDQYLLPFYRRDLASGVLTREGALSLLHEFFHKNNQIMAPTDHMSQEVEATRSTLEVAYDDPNYIILGGLLPGRVPGVNELTSLFARAAHDLRLRNPFIVLRWYRGIDQAFWREAVAAMRDNATLVVYDDETMIPAFRAYRGRGAGRVRLRAVWVQRPEPARAGGWTPAALVQPGEAVRAGDEPG